MEKGTKLFILSRGVSFFHGSGPQNISIKMYIMDKNNYIEINTFLWKNKKWWSLQQPWVCLKMTAILFYLNGSLQKSIFHLERIEWWKCLTLNGGSNHFKLIDLFSQKLQFLLSQAATYVLTYVQEKGSALHSSSKKVHGFFFFFFLTKKTPFPKMM